MANDGAPPKNTGIPSWQINYQHKPEASKQPPAPEALEEGEKQEEHSSTEQQLSDPAVLSTHSRKDSVEEATKLLKDDSLKDATVEEKAAFLASKGVGNQVIEEALSIATPATDASKTTAIAASQTPAASPSTSRASSNTIPSPHSSNPAYMPASTNSSHYQQPSRSTQDTAPPIITYPEFLLQAQKPPPLITAPRLLNTAYIVSGIAAALYGAQKYLFAPMTDSLTSSRHDLAAHTQEQLAALNERLKGVISSEPQPGISSAAAVRGQQKVHFEDGNESDDSDPTELFHRDFGTQTSPSLQGEGEGSDSSTGSESTGDGEGNEGVDAHARDLSRIRDLCAALVEEMKDEDDASEEVHGKIKVFKEELEPMLGFSTVFPGNGIYNTGGGSKDKGDEDEIGRFKTEIRSVKGVLLSARNFPRGRGRVVLEKGGVDGVAAS